MLLCVDRFSTVHYFLSNKCPLFRLIKKDHLHFNLTGEPYNVGDNITVSCEITRIKGNIPENALQVTIGESTFYGSLSPWIESTRSLSFYEVLTIRPSHDNTNISCRYQSPNGTYQEEYATIILAVDMWKRMYSVNLPSKAQFGAIQGLIHIRKQRSKVENM